MSGGQQEPQQASPVGASTSRRHDVLQQSVLSEITEQVFLAGVSAVVKPGVMRAAGITHVLNLAAVECSHLTYDDGSSSCDQDDPPAHMRPSKKAASLLGVDQSSPAGGPGQDESRTTSSSTLLDVRHVTLRDSQDQSLLPYLDDLVDYVTQAVASGGRVLVHCVAGVSRSASVVIAYLMRERGMSLREAHDHVKARRDVIRPNPGFWAALVEYELDLRGENSVQIYNYAAGSAPNLDSYQKEMMLRMRLGWMDHVFYNFGAHVLILVVQMVSSLWLFDDYS